ncbi:MAG TPA: hypothetical protein VF803_03700 [Candidatus Paceibacterota bacterium]
MSDLKREIIGISLIVAIIALALGTDVLYRHLHRAAVVPSAMSTSTPLRTDFGSTTPTGFPADIPVERGTTLMQSYSLSYVGKNQLSISFDSVKTVEENYELYESYLSGAGFSITNTYRSAALASLYGVSTTTEINVTIRESAGTLAKSQVNIGVLEK